MTVDADRSRFAAERIAEAIRGAREQAGQTPNAIAERAGIDPASYSAIERGDVDVPLEALVGIGAALDLTVAELFERARL